MKHECLSPTFVLTGKKNLSSSSSSQNEVLEEQKHDEPADKEKEESEYEGYMLRKTPDNSFKSYWYSLMGKELFIFRKKEDDKLKGMNNLVGTFISDEPNITHNGNLTLSFADPL